jgi:site-specific recombinase XerD
VSVASKDIRILLEAIVDYLQWLKAVEEPRANRASKHYSEVLSDFAIFSMHNDIAWNDMFSFETFREFRNYTDLKNTSHALISFSGYLHDRGTILKPLEMPNYQVQLPAIYEQYLLHLQQTNEPSNSNLGAVRRVLVPFHQYLEHHKIDLASLKIGHLDAFLAEFNKPFASRTRSSFRYRLRGFLKYLYYERRLLRTDLAPLLVGPPEFRQSSPPKFLRRGEVERLFANLTVDTPTEIRTYAMVYLAYTLGLRPVEISKITLDDISFQRAELIVRKRKTNNPAILPIAETTLKAVAAYVLKARPTSTYREVFLSAVKPHKPVSPATVIHHIAKAMRKAGLDATTYWLRHSYAQHLLHIGSSIYEIKEMMGHENIQSTQRYLHIHTEMMRKVIFDETL